jgi:hypothetical protein
VEIAVRSQCPGQLEEGELGATQVFFFADQQNPHPR